MLVQELRVEDYCLIHEWSKIGVTHTHMILWCKDFPRQFKHINHSTLLIQRPDNIITTCDSSLLSSVGIDTPLNGIGNGIDRGIGTKIDT